MLKTFLPRLHRFTAARLSPDGQFGWHLTAGVALMLLAAWVFAGIAEDVVTNDSITVLDVHLAHWFHAHATPGFTRAMLLVTHMHSVPGIAVLTLPLAVWMYRKGAHDWLLALAVAVPGGMLLNVLMKYTFQRSRPRFDEPLLQLSTYSFPSGHTAAATLLYGLLACYLFRQVHSWGGRIAIAVAACAMVALVGLSRMYLGVHYLSDVLAAVAEGCAWLAICITAVSTLRRRRAARGQPFWRKS
jgi:membrane-associated phospholipid phosphatase